LNRNRFVGTVPATIALLPAVASINLADNALTGDLPATFWTNPLRLTALCAGRRSSPQSTRTQARTHAKHSSEHCTHALTRTFTRKHARAPCKLLCWRRSVKANQLTGLATPTTNGTCCAKEIYVGPTCASGQPLELRADGFLYAWANKTVPIGNITACAADAANPGKRTNPEWRGEQLFTFKLSMPAGCDGIRRLNVMSEKARPRTHALCACLRGRVRHPSSFRGGMVGGEWT
jgi:hypothetical protein